MDSDSVHGIVMIPNASSKPNVDSFGGRQQIEAMLIFSRKAQPKRYR